MDSVSFPVIPLEKQSLNEAFTKDILSDLYILVSKELQMNKLHSIALFTMLTPAITLSSGLALAQQTSGQNLERDQQTQHQSSQGAQHSGQSDNQSAAARLAADGRNDMEHRGFMDAAPTNGMHISNLMEAEVKTSNDEEVGSVNDLIVDEDGQIVAIVIGVGGFL
ncbi:MAG: PRC-barrel domain-containing protein, partial [Pseudohongiella sp.]